MPIPRLYIANKYFCLSISLGINLVSVILISEATLVVLYNTGFHLNFSTRLLDQLALVGSPSCKMKEENFKQWCIKLKIPDN